jgi:phenylacetate-CoA ligase
MSVAAQIDPTTPEAIRARVTELLERDRWPRERLLALQRERLRALLRHAVSRSPYYREALGPDAADDDLSSLPTLPKPLLMEQFDRIVTDPRLRRADLEAFLAEADAGRAFLGDFRVFSTAGTTGVPGIFVFSHAEFSHWITVGLAALARVGVTPGDALRRDRRPELVAHHAPDLRGVPGRAGRRATPQRHDVRR